MNLLFLIGAIIVCILIYLFIHRRERYRIGYIEYRIIPDFYNKKEAAMLINVTNERIIKFLEHLKYKYRINVTTSEKFGSRNSARVYDIVHRILRGYNPEVIVENDPRYSTDTSYIVNKGEKIVMCVRQEENPKEIVDADVLFFVMLHEISHIGNRSWGHEMDFWETFKFILYEAMECGIYTPINYKLFPVRYCGMDITYSPLYDKEVADIRA